MILTIAKIYDKTYEHEKKYSKFDVNRKIMFMSKQQLRNLLLDPDIDSWIGYNRGGIIDKTDVEEILGCGIFTDNRLDDNTVDICYEYKDIVRTTFD